MELRERITELAEVKRLLKQYEELAKTKEMELVVELQARRLKTTTAVSGDKVYTATFVQGTRHDLDEIGLLEELGDKAESVLMTKLDRVQLQMAMDNGSIDPSVVGKYVTERKNKPSVRITERSADSPA